MPGRKLGTKKCKECNRDYEQGALGKFCSESCILIHQDKYWKELKDTSLKIWHKYWG